MENMNENVVMDNEVVETVDGTESTRPKAGTVIGVVALGGCAIYGAVQLAKKGFGWCKRKIGAARAKKAKDGAVETTYEEVTDK